MNLRRILSQTALIIGALIFSIGLQAYAQTFVQPSTGPTGGNAQAPLDTGPNPNTKAGALQVNGFANIGQSYLEGNVGIGTTNPQSALDVNGNISATGNIYSAGCPSSSLGYWGTLSSGVNMQTAYVQEYDGTGGNYCSPNVHVYQCVYGSWQQMAVFGPVGMVVSSNSFTPSANDTPNASCSASGF